MRHPGLDDPDLPLAELIERWPDTVPVFLRHKMLCVGCLISPFHTIVDACAEYNLSESDFLAELREATSV